MSNSIPNHSRRQWLKLSGLSAGGALAAGGLGSLLLPGRQAQAATDYKALVCVFLYGGNDGLNTIVPMDARYSQYSAVRKTLALPKSSLLPLSSTQYGLHPALSALMPAWNQKRLATVFNVGPLEAPLTKAAYRAAVAGSPLIPSSLFSHSDQQTLWETSTATSLTRTGWGGRASDAMGTANPVISLGGTCRFGLSAGAVPLGLPDPGVMFSSYELQPEAWRLRQAGATARANTMRSMYRRTQDSDLAEAYAKMQRDAFDKADRLGEIVTMQPGNANGSAAIDAAFAPVIAGGKLKTPIAMQLYQAAKLIANNALVGGNRQIFFAAQGGFDTHWTQAAADPTQGVHADLLRPVAEALAAFDAAMNAIGMGNAVTTFTQSDFGRTFVMNGSNGTDHAWGNNHLILGGAVKGGTTYGVYPELVLGGADDVGAATWENSGRWIPTISVDQYAATLLSWFGASASQLDLILPNLRNFGAKRNIAFV